MATTKPLELWLGVGGLVVGFLLYLFAKSPLAVVLCVLAIFGLLAYPVWNFWWIEDSYARRIGALLILAGLSVILADLAWPNAPEPLAVSPVTANLTNLFSPISGVAKGKIDIKIYNRDDNPYYQVIVKLIINSASLGPEAINIAFPSLEDKVKAGHHPAQVGNAAFCLRGVDAKNRKAFVCVLKELDPKQVFTIRLTTDSEAPKELLDKDSLLSIVAKFEKEPALTPEGPEASGLFVQFSEGTFPEGPFTWDKAIFFCSDAAPPDTMQFDPRVVLCTRDSTTQPMITQSGTPMARFKAAIVQVLVRSPTQGAGNPELHFFMLITNYGGAPSIAKDWGLTVNIPGKEEVHIRPVHNLGFIDYQVDGKAVRVQLATEDLIDKAARNPIAANGQVSGILSFSFPAMTIEEIMRKGTTFALTFYDAFETKYTVGPSTISEFQKPPPLHIPGIQEQVLPTTPPKSEEK